MSGPALIRCAHCGEPGPWLLAAEGNQYWEVLSATEAGLQVGPERRFDNHAHLRCEVCNKEDNEWYEVPAACPVHTGQE